ncbi:uncharacterized protein LOC134270022 [Saccostrea cucullata]|uniref:uncharacterized protein LOC134270022 n=1 Tax=Saccostrea cuccullata TaxID=36930 RepID=UPI002ED05CCF
MLVLGGVVWKWKSKQKDKTQIRTSVGESEKDKIRIHQGENSSTVPDYRYPLLSHTDTAEDLKIEEETIVKFELNKIHEFTDAHVLSENAEEGGCVNSEISVELDEREHGLKEDSNLSFDNGKRIYKVRDEDTMWEQDEKACDCRDTFANDGANKDEIIKQIVPTHIFGYTASYLGNYNIWKPKSYGMYFAKS